MSFRTRTRTQAANASCGDCHEGCHEGWRGVKLKASLQQDRSAVEPKALHEILHISSCSLQADIKEESLDENHIVISTQI